MNFCTNENKKEQMETLQERLQKIIWTSYQILQNKIVGGIYTIENEASLQLLFGEVLLDVGRLHTYSWDERFIVGREFKYAKTTTSKNDNEAICDISLRLVSGQEECTAAIEMKYLKKSKFEAVTDNRFSVLQDIENLEHYPVDLGVMLVYSDNSNYADPDTTSYLKIGDGNIIHGEISTTGSKTRKVVFLKNSYKLQWDTFETKDKTHCFMLQYVNPIK